MRARLIIALLTLASSSGAASAAQLYFGAGQGGDVEAGLLRRDLEHFTETRGGSWRLFAGVELGRRLAIELGRHDLGRQACCAGVADLGFSSRVVVMTKARCGAMLRASACSIWRLSCGAK